MKIKNAWICRIQKESVVPIFGDLEISDGKIISVIKRDPARTNFTNTNSSGIINAGGRLLTIPQVNFHDHFYSRLVKGLPLKGELNSFTNILKNLWWRLDVELDIDLVKASAQMAVLESVRQGVTYIFDHHSSPESSMGSLKAIADVISEIDLNAVLCFETTDRNGIEPAKEGIEENRSFLLDNSNENIKSMVGLHASFTLSDESLLRASKLINEFDLGIHIHLCEDKIDTEESLKQFNLSPVERLNRLNLLNNRSILSHGIHLSADDYKTIAQYGCAIAYNPDSNMNNNVGIASLNIPSGINIITGTDGMHSNPARSLKQIFLLSRHSGFSFEKSFALIQRIYFNQLDFVSKYFPAFTSLNEGDRADFIIWDYIPPTPVFKENFLGHYIYGAIERPIHSVFNYGAVLMKNFKINIDEENYNSNITKQGKRLYTKLLNS
jgi:cytosine/adenosine deaminase-related metal-dependent hydrolase